MEKQLYFDFYKETLEKASSLYLEEENEEIWDGTDITPKKIICRQTCLMDELV